MINGITFDDVLLIPSYNHHDSRKNVSTKMTDKTGKLTLQLPIMSANMDTITESAMAIFMAGKGGAGVLHRFMSIEDNIKEMEKVWVHMAEVNAGFPVFASVGASEKELLRVEALKGIKVDYYCVDVANGHAKYVGRMIKRMREMLGESACIMAGNVATYAGADYLASVGADIIKVGIGPGSVCTTRIKTGFGVPQLTAIQQSARVDRSIVADGGLKTAGDIVKALAFGADFVMVGGMLAGTRPTPGEVLEETLLIENPFKTTYDQKVTRYKSYRGMASKEAADDYSGGLTEWKTAEGVATTVPYREDEDAIIADIVGGLRSGLTYAGAATITEMQRKLDYTIISQAARIESLPHKTL